MTEIITGFEGKTMKAVVCAWLYCEDQELINGAAKELHRRFSRVWPRPIWIPERIDSATDSNTTS